MPNWAEGTLKIRGKRENIAKFLEKGTNEYQLNWETMKSEVMSKDYFSTRDWEGDLEVMISREVYIEGTTRAFMGDCDIYLYDGEESQTVAVPFRQAWAVSAEEIGKLRDKWDLDFRVYAVECGMGFVQEVIAARGEELVDWSEEYDDWVWECPFPYLGG